MIKETTNEAERVDYYERLIRLKEELSENEQLQSKGKKVTTMGCPKDI